MDKTDEKQIAILKGAIAQTDRAIMLGHHSIKTMLAAIEDIERRRTIANLQQSIDHEQKQRPV